MCYVRVPGLVTPIRTCAHNLSTATLFDLRLTLTPLSLAHQSTSIATETAFDTPNTTNNRWFALYNPSVSKATGRLNSFTDTAALTSQQL